MIDKNKCWICKRTPAEVNELTEECDPTIHASINYMCIVEEEEPKYIPLCTVCAGLMHAMAKELIECMELDDKWPFKT